MIGGGVSDNTGIGSTSDGYHTFDELYEHRIALFIALCRSIYRDTCWHHQIDKLPWRSLKHSDGSFIEDWFVLGIGRIHGKQITYHLPIGMWDQVVGFAETLECAPEFDGHTPADVLERLKLL